MQYWQLPVDHRFGDLELPVTIARAIEKMGFTTPTEVQARAIPPLRAGGDVIGQAQTGTGKTAAFGIPIIERIDPASSAVQALILTPTRELCQQVTEEIARIGLFRGVEAGGHLRRRLDGAQIKPSTAGRRSWSARRAGCSTSFVAAS